MQHYVLGTRGSTIDAASLSVPAAYLSSARERRWQRALRSGVPAPFGDWKKLSGGSSCPVSSVSALTAQPALKPYMIFDCPLYDAIRLRFPDLFNCPATLHAFVDQPTFLEQHLEPL